jgi:hypothetical protein
MNERALEAKDIIRLPDARKQVHAQLREVIHDVHGKPARFIRVRLTGWHFPQRALEPFMVIGNAASRFVQISPDGATADGYFAAEPPAAKRLEFGYGTVVSWEFPVAIRPERIQRVDRSTLPSALQRLFG